MKVAVFLPNWIGDVVMATPALRALRQHYAAAELIAVSKPYVGGVLEGLDWFDETICLDSTGPWAGRWPGAARVLRKSKPDVAVLFANTFRSALTAWLGGCRRIIGFDRYLRGPLLTDKLYHRRDQRDRYVPTPIIDDYNRLALTAGCADPGHRMELATTPADEQAAERVWRKFRLDDYPEIICLNPGAAFGAAKYWPAEYFVQLAHDLHEERGCGILVLCGPSERELARRIAAQVNHPAVHSLADEAVSLGLTKALVRRATLLVTTDSGPRHFAAALGCPVVALFGPTHIEWTETYYARAVHLQKKFSCGPCQLRVCPLDHRCMKELTPAEVLQAVHGLLNVRERKAS